MNRAIIPFLMIIHLLYISSSYVVDGLPRNEFVAQLYIFSLYVFVYLISFFKKRLIKYVVIPFYFLLMYRIALGIFPSFEAGDYSFFSMTLVSIILVVALINNVFRDRSLRIPSKTNDRVFLLLWVITISFISMFSAGILAKEVNKYTCAFALIFISSFTITPYITAKKRGMRIVSTLLLCSLSIPYINSILVYNGGLYVGFMTITPLCLIGLTLLSLVWQTKSANKA